MSSRLQRIISYLIMLLTLWLNSSGFIAKPYNQIKDVKYGDGSAQIMDIYLPKNASGNTSAFLYLHDGNFKDGSRSGMERDCQIAANKGYVAATMDYSLITTPTLFKPNTTTLKVVLDEISDAIRTLKNTAAENGVHLTSLALGGQGAGGYYAMMYTAERAPWSSITIKFAVAKSAPAEFSYEIWKDTCSASEFAALVNALANVNLPASAYENNTASAVTACESVSVTKALAKCYDKIPFLTAYSDKDTQVPYANWTALDKALTAYGITHDTVLYANAAHSLNNRIIEDSEYTDLLLSYCSRYFG